MAMCSEIASSTLKRDILPPGVHTLTSTPPVGVKSAAWSSSSMAKVASLTWMHPGGGMGGGEGGPCSTRTADHPQQVGRRGHSSMQQQQGGGRGVQQCPSRTVLRSHHCRTLPPAPASCPRTLHAPCPASALSGPNTLYLTPGRSFTSPAPPLAPSLRSPYPRPPQGTTPCT